MAIEISIIFLILGLMPIPPQAEMLVFLGMAAVLDFYIFA
jgi:hypothetical protein